ncbi:MAG: DNA repair and recombination protein RadA [Nitrososphaeraceae archaeon]
MERIQTGSNNLDRLLCGGIETNAITEFYGASGSGKTQICHTLCVVVSQSRSKDGIFGKSIYIDTAGTFRPERIVCIADARGFSTSCALSNILYRNVTISDKQEFIIENIQSLINNYKNTRLLVIDSIVGNYRAEYQGTHMLSKRQQKLYHFMCKLSSIAQNNEIAAVVTNQVNSRGHHLYEDNPAGGSIMAHAATYRIHLRRLHSSPIKIAARIVKSSYHPENEAYFILSEKGLEDNQ